MIKLRIFAFRSHGALGAPPDEENSWRLLCPDVWISIGRRNS